MNLSTLRGGTKVLVSCALAAAIAGCGEDVVCQTEVLVAISEPSSVVTADRDPATDGVQTEVRVQSTFDRGVTLTLTVEEDLEVLAEYTTTTDAEGNAVFEDVTVPANGADLRVVGGTGACGFDEDVRRVTVIAGAGCELEFAEAPADNDFYAPLDVFDAAADASPGVPGYQGDVIVRAPAGHEVRLFMSSPGNLEELIGSGTAADNGELRLAIGLPEGQDSLRAACTGPGGAGARSSSVLTVFVDTIAPTCTLTAPLPGTSITPSLDADQDLDNGVQLALAGHADGGDVAGEPADFVLTAPGGGMTTLPAGSLDGAGAATADASFDPETTPADFGVRFSARDHAGNPCETTATYRVVYEGCPIVVTAPLATVTSDADGDGTNGAQVDIVVDVDDACAGRPLESDCGSNDVGGTVGPGGDATLRADVCEGLPCESSELCTVRVTSADGIETTAGVALRFDNQPPNVSLQVAAPGGVACGGTVTPAQDVDAATAGTQITMRVVSPAAADRQLRLTNLAGTATFPANGTGGEVTVTVENGNNDFVGSAADAAGNTATTPGCRIVLADLAVNFTGSPADGAVGAGDGTAAGGSLTFTLTGTVSSTGATVEVTVDGGAPLPAVVTGTSWSLPLTLAERPQPYVLVATATAGPRVGAATLSLTVDLTGPSAVSDLAGSAATRRSIRLAFTAPADGGARAAGYRVRYATTALSDANFDTTGTAFTAPAPAAPGTPQSVVVMPLRTGTAYWVGIAAVDAAGNRSTAEIVGPLTPRFDASAVFAAPQPAGDASLGYAIVHGRFNDDSFEDVAVAAPFADAAGVGGAGEVYVYLGSASGLAATPALTIRGTTVGGGFGSSLARVRWSSAARDDLAIGEPFGAGGSGAIYVFNGGAALPTGAVLASSAPRRIGVSATSNWFTGSALGWQLASADHDGDGIVDLVTTAVFGNGGAAGAVVVLYGGTVPSGAVNLSDLSAAGSGSAVMRMYEHTAFFGFHLHNLGRTQGPGDAADDLGAGFAEDGMGGADLVVVRAQSGRPAAPGITREPITAGRDVTVRYATGDAQLEWGLAMGSIADQNGDGARDLVIADFRAGADAGVVFIVDGDTVGTGGVAATDAPGVVLATFGESVAARRLGMAVVNGALTGAPDVDGDGIEDLVVVGRVPGQVQAQMKVWFGPLPLGTTQQPPAPHHTIDAPASFASALPSNGGSPMTAIWAGDVNGDGLDDICWADRTSNGLDGGFQVLSDDGT